MSDGHVRSHDNFPGILVQYLKHTPNPSPESIWEHAVPFRYPRGIVSIIGLDCEPFRDGEVVIAVWGKRSIARNGDLEDRRTGGRVTLKGWNHTLQMADRSAQLVNPKCDYFSFKLVMMTQIHEGGFCAGEKFRNLRIHQKLGHCADEDFWRSHMKTKEQHAFNRIYMNSDKDALAKAFDELLPMEGLWGDFHFGAIKDFVYMRCTEVSTSMRCSCSA